jgi:ketosteroid isomerase-like protein
VVALCDVSFRHKRTGKVATSPKVDVHRFRDGKISEFFEYYDTAGLAAAVV